MKIPDYEFMMSIIILILKRNKNNKRAVAMIYFQRKETKFLKYENCLETLVI